MPGYTGTGHATLLRTNQQKYFWNAETVAAGSLSVAFQLERRSGAFYKWGASFEVSFGGAPGAFEVDILGVNDDRAANYVQLGSIVAVNTTNAGRWDLSSNLWPKFVAAYLKTLTNAVTVTAQIMR